MKTPWLGYIKPFRMFGGLYFVGTRPASTHIIDTGDGLIMLDSGYPQSLYLVTEGIREMGFSPMDIKYIVHSHGHYDHLGATKALVELTGAKTFIGEQDVPYANGSVNLTWANELGYDYVEAFEPDVALRDGDTIELGNVCIKAIHTPGHTPGSMSYFFDLEENGRVVRAGTFGGVGVNTLRKSFLDKYNLPYSAREDFINSIKKIRDEKVDLNIGNHAHCNDTEGKYARMGKEADNPFIDPTEFARFADATLEMYNEIIIRRGE